MNSSYYCLICIILLHLVQGSVSKGAGKGLVLEDECGLFPGFFDTSIKTVVRIGRDNGPMRFKASCKGVLVGDQQVLTTAHCIKKLKKVRVDPYNPTQDFRGFIPSMRICRSPHFVEGINGNHVSNFAIIQLNETLHKSSKVALLPTEKLYEYNEPLLIDFKGNIQRLKDSTCEFEAQTEAYSCLEYCKPLDVPSSFASMKYNKLLLAGRIAEVTNTDEGLVIAHNNQMKPTIIGLNPKMKRYISGELLVIEDLYYHRLTIKALMEQCEAELTSPQTDGQYPQNGVAPPKSVATKSAMSIKEEV